VFKLRINCAQDVDIPKELARLELSARRHGLNDAAVSTMLSSVGPLLASLNASAEEARAHGISISLTKTAKADNYEIVLTVQSGQKERKRNPLSRLIGK